MDGNGRWASSRGLKRTEGHAAGEEALFDTVEGALELGINWLTVYAFSTENWRRPLDEVRFLMNFNESLLLRRRDELHERGVRIRFSGRRGGRVPARVLRRMEESEELTRRNRKMTLVIAFNYGGRAELVDAARGIARGGGRRTARSRQGRREGPGPAPLPARRPRPRPAGADLGGVPPVQLPALAAGLRRAVLHRRALARLPPGAPLRGRRGLPDPRAPLRRPRTTSK